MNLFRKLFGAKTAPEQSEPPLAGTDAPIAGQIYAFRNSPFSEFAPRETGRYAAFKVIGTTKELFVIAVLEGVWPVAPSLQAIRRAPILRQHRFAHTGRPAVCGVNADGWNPSTLDDLRLLGLDVLSPQESAAARAVLGYEAGTSFSNLRFATRTAEGEWRWRHDREALEAEWKRVEAAATATRAAQEERYRTRLKGLTWDKLLAETPFERWSPSPPFPPEAFTQAARTMIHDACRELQLLGPKPRKADVRRVLRRCVEWFNAEDERAGGVIETEEREDIMAVLEEMAFVAKQKSLVEEIDGLRDW